MTNQLRKVLPNFQCVGGGGFRGTENLYALDELDPSPRRPFAPRMPDTSILSYSGKRSRSARPRSYRVEMSSDRDSLNGRALFTIREASDRLHVSPSLIYALCARGLLDHHRCGLGRGTIRITEKALEVYLQRSKVTGGGAAGANDTSFKNLDAQRMTRAWKEQGVL